MRKNVAIVVVALALSVSTSGPSGAAGASSSGAGGSVLKTTTGGGEILTNEKIIALVKAGFSDDLIVRKIKTAARTLFDLNVDTGLLNLKQADVSENIIGIMMDIWEKQQKIHNQNIRIYIQMLRTDRRDEYDTAMRELVSYGAYACPLLVENLRHEDERIRAGCSEVLGRIGDPASLDSLFQALVNRNKAVRARAAQAVSAFDRKVVAPRLAEAIEKRGLPRDGFALALGYLSDLKHLPALLRLADDPASETDRAAAAYALGLLGDPRPEVLEVLKEAVLNDTFRELREAASRALATLGPRMGPAAKADVGKALVSAMKRFSVGRNVLALQLRHFPTRRAVEALLEQIEDRDKDVAGASWEALKAITGEVIPQDASQWRSWWQIATIQPRWREVHLPAPAGDDAAPADEPEPLPVIPGFGPFGAAAGPGEETGAEKAGADTKRP